MLSQSANIISIIATVVACLSAIISFIVFWKAKKSAKEIDGYLGEKTIIYYISESFLKAEDISNKLQQVNNINVFLCLLSDERQELDRIYRYLEDIKFIDEAQIENYKKKTFGIKAKLQSVLPQFQQKVQELVTKCDKIMNLCKSMPTRD